MSATLEINVLQDTATPMLNALSKIGANPEVRSEMADQCIGLTRSHVVGLGTNKMGWPSTGFYKEISRNGITSAQRSDGFSVFIDHPDKPGAMRQRYYGGTIHMKDRLLTIPARAEYYGHRAGEFSGLKYAQFKSGAKALIVDFKGEGKVNFGTGKSFNRKGLGGSAVKKAKEQRKAIVAFWLRESVTQAGNPSVIPTGTQYLNVCTNVLMKAVQLLKGGR